MADAPKEMAVDASSREEMQQTFMRGGMMTLGFWTKLLIIIERNAGAASQAAALLRHSRMAGGSHPAELF
jgi:hypothetical protein